MFSTGTSKEGRPSRPAAFALIIGVRDYHTYDPSGGKDLPGARNDAIYWWRQLVLTQRFDPENVTVLTSPVLLPDELGWDDGELELAGKSPLGEATHVAIMQAYHSLARDVEGDASALEGDDAPQSVGVFAWSGHGSTLLDLKQMLQTPGEGLILCPSDYNKVGGKGIRLKDLIRTRGGDGASPQGEGTGAQARCQVSEATTRRITYFLDACYSTEAGETQGGRGGRSARSRSLKTESLAQAIGAGSSEPSSVQLHDFEGRLMLAAHVQNLAHEARIGGEMRGAWSWAMMTLMDQWRQAPIFPGGRELRPLVRHEDLNHACRELLSLLNLEQGPRYAGLTQMEDMALFQPQEGRPTVALSDRPDGSADEVQLTGNADGIYGYDLLFSPDSPDKATFVRVGMILSGTTKMVKVGEDWKPADVTYSNKESWYLRECVDDTMVKYTETVKIVSTFFINWNNLKEPKGGVIHTGESFGTGAETTITDLKRSIDVSGESWPKQYPNFSAVQPEWKGVGYKDEGLVWFTGRSNVDNKLEIALGLGVDDADNTLKVVWLCGSEPSDKGIVLGCYSGIYPSIVLTRAKERPSNLRWWVQASASPSSAKTPG